MSVGYDVYFAEMKKVMINNIELKEIERICRGLWKGLTDDQKGVYAAKAKNIKPGLN